MHRDRSKTYSYSTRTTDVQSWRSPRSTMSMRRGNSDGVVFGQERPCDWSQKVKDAEEAAERKLRIIRNALTSLRKQDEAFAERLQTMQNNIQVLEREAFHQDRNDRRQNIIIEPYESESIMDSPASSSPSHTSVEMTSSISIESPPSTSLSMPIEDDVFPGNAQLGAPNSQKKSERPGKTADDKVADDFSPGISSLDEQLEESRTLVADKNVNLTSSKEEDTVLLSNAKTDTTVTENKTEDAVLTPGMNTSSECLRRNNLVLELSSQSAEALLASSADAALKPYRAQSETDHRDLHRQAVIDVCRPGSGELKNASNRSDLSLNHTAVSRDTDTYTPRSALDLNSSMPTAMPGEKVRMFRQLSVGEAGVKSMTWKRKNPSLQSTTALAYEHIMSLQVDLRKKGRGCPSPIRKFSHVQDRSGACTPPYDRRTSSSCSALHLLRDPSPICLTANESLREVNDTLPPLERKDSDDNSPISTSLSKSPKSHVPSPSGYNSSSSDDGGRQGSSPLRLEPRTPTIFSQRLSCPVDSPLFGEYKLFDEAVASPISGSFTLPRPVRTQSPAADKPLRSLSSQPSPPPRHLFGRLFSTSKRKTGKLS